jgi:hypothetical protein
MCYKVKPSFAERLCSSSQEPVVHFVDRSRSQAITVAALPGSHFTGKKNVARMRRRLKRSRQFAGIHCATPQQTVIVILGALKASNLIQIHIGYIFMKLQDPYHEMQ